MSLSKDKMYEPAVHLQCKDPPAGDLSPLEMREVISLSK